MAKRIQMDTTDVRGKANPSHREQLAFERVLFFTDAVFAIAITLLALEIRLPENGEILGNDALFSSLLQIWPKYLAYIISFLVIGIFWIGHHRKFQYFLRSNNTLIYLNFLLLMVVAFIPFPASVLSQSGNRTSTIFYASTMTVAGLLSVLIWVYAIKQKDLIDPAASPLQRKKELWSPLIMSAVFLLSIGIAFINDDIAKILWGLIALTPFLFRDHEPEVQEENLKS